MVVRGIITRLRCLQSNAIGHFVLLYGSGSVSALRRIHAAPIPMHEEVRHQYAALWGPRFEKASPQLDLELNIRGWNKLLCLGVATRTCMDEES